MLNESNIRWSSHKARSMYYKYKGGKENLDRKKAFRPETADEDSSVWLCRQSLPQTPCRGGSLAALYTNREYIRSLASCGG